MERNSSGNMKYSDCNKVKETWDCNDRGFNGGDYPGGFSWPPRSYTCSFCRREFRSAQALGGHMNVHRRDRARLRQSPPWDGQCSNPNPNPNPNINSSSSSSTSNALPPFTYKSSSWLSPSRTDFTSPPSSTSIGSEANISSAVKDGNLPRFKTINALLGVADLKNFGEEEDECKVSKKGEMVRLDLQIGLLTNSKEDLDLELRLGYS